MKKSCKIKGSPLGCFVVQKPLACLVFCKCRNVCCDRCEESVRARARAFFLGGSGIIPPCHAGIARNSLSLLGSFSPLKRPHFRDTDIERRKPAFFLPPQSPLSPPPLFPPSLPPAESGKTSQDRNGRRKKGGTGTCVTPSSKTTAGAGKRHTHTHTHTYTHTYIPLFRGPSNPTYPKIKKQSSLFSKRIACARTHLHNYFSFGNSTLLSLFL